MKPRQTIVKMILDNVAPDIALMVYGSEARNEATEKSDIDVLRITQAPRPTETLDRLQVSSYTISQLEVLGQQGSLFLLHLITDGIALHDPRNILARLPGLYREPSSYAPLFAQLREVTRLINVDQQGYQESPSQLERLLAFASRSFLYAEAAQENPCFSLQKLAGQGSAIAKEVIRLKMGGGTYADFRRLLELLSNELGSELDTPSESIDRSARNVDVSSSMIRRFISDLQKNSASGPGEMGYAWLAHDR